MKMPSRLLALAFGGSLLGGCVQDQSAQSQIDIASYKKAESLNSKAADINVNVVNADFSQGDYGWNLPNGYKVEQNGGVNGSPGLFYERADASAPYVLCHSKRMKIEAGKKYIFGVSVRSESVRCPASTFQCVALEIYKDGKFITGTYPAYRPSKEWTNLEGELLTDQDCEAHLTLYMERGVTGKIWFDNAKIERSDFETWAIHQLYPKMSTLFADSGTGVFKVAKFGAQPANLVAYAEMRNAAGSIIAKAEATPDKDGIANLNFGKGLPLGDAKISVKALDTERKLIITEKDIPVKVASKQEKGPRVCSVDAKGRMLVDGKPYLPVGLFLGGVTREDIKRLAGTPFNCIVPYNTQSMKFKDSKKTGLEGVKEVLDELNKNNIKIVFSIKDLYDGYPKIDKVWKLYGAQNAEDSVKRIVEALKDHPAILAWYVCDEFDRNWIERLEKRKAYVNSLDSKHPTWAVYYKYEDLALFASTCDVMGVDPYPIEKPGPHNMNLVRQGMDAGVKTCATPDGAALWGVPQLYNFGNYVPQAKADRDYRLKNFVDPTEDEMRAMSLLMAIKGAKGFIGYSYFDLFVKCAEQESAKRWPEVCRVGETLKELGPYILSDKTGPEAKVENVKGEVFAKAFSDDRGKVKVLIAAIGPGKAEAVVSLPEGLKLKSKYGKTQTSGDGRFTFQGEDVCCDILE